MKTEEEIIFERYLLLEKDHRQKMIKFGIPKEVADFLHEFNDKYSIWFANEFKKIDAFKNAHDKVNWIRNRALNNMTGIIDWVRNTPNLNLKDYNWITATTAQREYHQNLESQSLQKKEDKKIIKQYDDGFYWVDLESSDCDEEADAMGHCARTSADTMLSLRKYTPETQSIEAFVTIAANPDDGNWQQAKGKKNSKPKEEYWKYIADILVEWELFVFKPEYNEAKDFTNNDLHDYIEAHSNNFENSDELLEKIDAFLIKFKDFEKYYDEKAGDLSYYSMCLDQVDNGEQEYVSHRISIQIPINLNFFGYYVGNVEEFLSGLEEDSYELKDIIYTLIREHVSYSSTDHNEGEDMFYIHGEIDGDSDISKLTDDGLDNFKQEVGYMVSNDEGLGSKVKNDEYYFEDLLKDYLIEKEILPHPDDPDAKPIKKIARSDPRQMKLDLSKKIVRFKKIFYS